MNENWKPIFSGIIEGRNVTLSRFSSGELKVSTTQKNTENTSFSTDGSTHLFPLFISEGDSIEVDADTADVLKQELQQIGFSAQGAEEVVAHARA